MREVDEELVLQRRVFRTDLAGVTLVSLEEQRRGLGVLFEDASGGEPSPEDAQAYNDAVHSFAFVAEVEDRAGNVATVTTPTYTLDLSGTVRGRALVDQLADDSLLHGSIIARLYSAAAIIGVDAALVVTPGASHSNLSQTPSQQAARTASVIAWFDRYRNANAE